MTIDSKNEIFAAALLFRSLRNGKFLSTNLWEESIILVKALSAEDAETIAAKLGKARNHSYRTCDETELSWEFFKVERVYAIEDACLETGTEVFSRHLRNAEVESLLKPFED